MRRFRWVVTLWVVALFTAVLYPVVPGAQSRGDAAQLASVARNAAGLLAKGLRVFRYDTFRDEKFWGGALRLHQAIAGAALGGVGPGVSPATALAVGLKVDSQALPLELVRAIQAGAVDLKSPATTLTLLKHNAVVGLTGFFDGGRLTSVGIQCALCHSQVDNRIMPGIGRRLDGWPNRDLNIGAIIALSPDLSPVTSLLGVDDATLRSVLNSWGPGRFDGAVFLDGKALRPDGKPGAVMIPAAFGLAGVNLHTYTGWGGVPHWNALVANLFMHGQGTFYDPRLANAARFPVAAAAGFDNVRNTPDLITSKLPALQLYQLSLKAPRPPAGSFNADAAAAGKAIFTGRARCSECHVLPLFTEPGWNMHTAAEIGIDDFQSSRSPDGRYRTTPLRGLFTRLKGGFYHDGRFKTYGAVVDHYNARFGLGLTAAQRQQLIEYLKSL